MIYALYSDGATYRVLYDSAERKTYLATTTVMSYLGANARLEYDSLGNGSNIWKIEIYAAF